QITAFSLDNATDVLTLTLEDGGTQTVDFTAVLAAAGTDDQALSLAAGNILTLEDGGTVDLTPYLDNTDDQQITAFSLDNATEVLTLTLEDGGTQTVDFTTVLAAAGTDDQALTITGANVLTLEDGGTVDLNPFLDNTDDQQITAFSLDNATDVLTLTLEDGGTQTVDFTTVLAAAGTDDQALSLAAGNILTLEDGGTVDLNPFLDNTDDQTATEVAVTDTAGNFTATDVEGALAELATGSTDDQALTITGANILTLEDGGTVDLNPFLDNTDDQQITAFSLDNTTDVLTLTLENGGTQTVDFTAVLAAAGTDDQTATEVAVTDTAGNFTATDVEGALAELATGSTDDQALTITGANLLTLEDGGTVDLTPFLDNTDDQTATEVAVTDTAGNFTATDVEGALAELATGSTDDQALTITGANILTLEDGGTVDLTPYLDNTDDQQITAFSLDNTTDVLTLTLEDGGTQTVDFTAVLAAAGTDDQTATEVAVTDTAGNFTATDVEGALAELATGSTDDQALTITGANILTLEDGGTVDLNPFLDNTDDQQITAFSLDNATDVLTLTLEDGG
ncbi:beta strand repeat-containing protein, partial [Maribacter sp. 2307ULW6-5]|uniref:beta strand repeat-containing protein n=1 Tax=Maribacter sp. 2307ULW6-5 TaxID=3386275 RepID=UPI0039BD4DBE